MIEFFFGYLSVVIVVLSILVISSKNPVHSVLWMLLMFFHIAGLYLLLNAEFLAAVQVIVYAGAILVLFLFVVMLLNLREELEAEQFIVGWPAGLTVALGLLITLLIGLTGFTTVYRGRWGIAEIEKATHTKALGQVMYTEYLLPFEIVSLILLVAIVGAVTLAKKRIKP